MICLDTCGTASDTVCQDGGWAASGNWCDFGTDCSDCGSRLLLDPPPSPPVFPPPPSPAPLPPGAGAEATSDSGAGAEATSDSGATQDAGPGLAIGLALGGCLLVAMLGATILVWHRKRRMQPPPSSASTAAPQQVEVIVTQPEAPERRWLGTPGASTGAQDEEATNKGAKAGAPQSLSVLLAACGLEHHEETFRAEGYTLDTLLSSMKQGEAVAKSDLRELKLTLGECRQLINQLKASK